MSKAADLRPHLHEAADTTGTCQRNNGETGWVLVETRSTYNKKQKTGSTSLFELKPALLFMIIIKQSQQPNCLDVCEARVR